MKNFIRSFHTRSIIRSNTENNSKWSLGKLFKGNTKETNSKAVSSNSNNNNSNNGNKNDDNLDDTGSTGQFNIIPKKKELIRMTRHRIVVKTRDYSKYKKVQEILRPEPKHAYQKLLTPIEQRLFLAKKFKFNKNEFPELKGKALILKKKEYAFLEPSVYVSSFRIRGSVKRITPILRMFRKMELNMAVAQARFSEKYHARELEDVFRRAIGDGKRLGFSLKDGLYIDQIWAGDDGNRQRELEPKGRSRTGIIVHRWSHVKMIIKTKETKDRIDLNKERKAVRQVRALTKPVSIRRRAPSYVAW